MQEIGVFVYFTKMLWLWNLTFIHGLSLVCLSHNALISQASSAMYQTLLISQMIGMIYPGLLRHC